MTTQYRIVEVTYNNGNKGYRIQKRWIFFCFIPTIWRTYSTHFGEFGPYIDWDLLFEDGDDMTIDKARDYIQAHIEADIHEDDTKIKETKVIEKYE